MRLLLALLLFNYAAFAYTAPADDLQALITEHWAWFLDQEPETRSYTGDHSAADRWNDRSLAAHYERDARRARFLSELGRINTADLGSEDQLNHAMLTQLLQNKRRRHALGLDLMTLSMRVGPQQLFTIAEYSPFETEHDYRNWISRLKRLPVNPMPLTPPEPMAILALRTCSLPDSLSSCWAM